MTVAQASVSFYTFVVPLVEFGTLFAANQGLLGNVGMAAAGAIGGVVGYFVAKAMVNNEFDVMHLLTTAGLPAAAGYVLSGYTSFGQIPDALIMSYLAGVGFFRNFMWWAVHPIS